MPPSNRRSGRHLLTRHRLPTRQHLAGQLERNLEIQVSPSQQHLPTPIRARFSVPLRSAYSPCLRISPGRRRLSRYRHRVHPRRPLRLDPPPPVYQSTGRTRALMRVAYLCP